MFRWPFLSACMALLAGICPGQPGYVLDVSDRLPSAPFRVAAGELTTLWVHGLGIELAGPVFAPKGVLPTTFEGVSVEVEGWERTKGPVHQAAILGLIPACMVRPCPDVVGVVVQIPFELDLNYRDLTGGGYINVSKNGRRVASLPTLPCSRLPRILKGYGALQTAFPEQPFSQTVRRVNGTLVHQWAPATPGESVKVLAVGLGYNDYPPGQPRPLTGVPAGPDERLTIGTGTLADAVGIAFRFGINREGGPVLRQRSGGLPSDGLVEVRMLEGFVGLYEIVFRVPKSVPPGTPSCGPSPDRSEEYVLHNLVVSIGLIDNRNYVPHLVYDTVGLCVRTGQ
ncbi:MAG: hypothetical protein JNL98_35740 [Bryobacterales bacterium]|nr:hypothetical protein [Bryobacterales bacterium]